MSSEINDKDSPVSDAFAAAKTFVANELSEVLSAFKAEPAKEPLPLTVTAPIVIDATTAEFVDFVESLTSHSNTETADAESERIQPYFAAMSAYLTEVLEKSDPERQEAGKGLTTRGALSGIFNAMAAKTRATIISDVAIVPDNINTTGPAADLFKNQQAFNQNYDYCGHPFNFGFFKVLQDTDDKMTLCNTVFPIFKIDHRMMDKVPADQLRPLLADFQKLMTFVNHDMLHHFTSPVINRATAEDFGRVGREISEWSQQIPPPASENYEHWAQMGQERVWLSHEDPAQMADIRATLDRYFDGLKHVGETLMQGAVPVSPKEKKQQAHEVVDFFGMIMAHALTRVFPLNHPVMAHCLNLLQQADPDPQQAVADCQREVVGYCLSKKKPAQLSAIRQGASFYLKDTVQSYRAQGFDMLPENDAAVGYAQLKLLSLAQLGTDDVRPHVPVPQNKDMAQLRSKEDQLMLDMVIAAAKVAQYKPS